MIVNINKSGAVTAKAETIEDVKVLLKYQKQKRTYTKKQK